VLPPWRVKSRRLPGAYAAASASSGPQYIRLFSVVSVSAMLIESLNLTDLLISRPKFRSQVISLCMWVVDRPPSAPQNLRYSFVITSTNITVQLVWQPPTTGEINGYRVTCARAGPNWYTDRRSLVTTTLSSVSAVQWNSVSRSTFSSHTKQYKLGLTELRETNHSCTIDRFVIIWVTWVCIALITHGMLYTGTVLLLTEILFQWAYSSCYIRQVAQST